MGEKPKYHITIVIAAAKAMSDQCIPLVNPKIGASIIATTMGCIPRKAASMMGLWRICEKKIATSSNIENEGNTTPVKADRAPR